MRRDEANGNLTRIEARPHTYPSVGQARPHAPTAVGDSSYGYEANGNLTSAEGRSDEYDVENRLVRAKDGTTEIRGPSYDGDGGLFLLSEQGTPKTRWTVRV